MAVSTRDHRNRYIEIGEGQKEPDDHRIRKKRPALKRDRFTPYLPKEKKDIYPKRYSFFSLIPNRGIY